MKTFTRRQCLTLASSAILAGLSLPNTALATDALQDNSSDSLPENTNSEREYSFTPEDADLEPEMGDDNGIATFAAAQNAVVELWGATRYETSREEAIYCSSSSKRLIIASGSDFPDSLAGSSLAGVLGCPIVLTAGDSLSSTTRETINRLGAKEFYVLGGTSAISSAVSDELAGMGTVQRLSGPTRFETQLAVFEYGCKSSLWSNDYAILASGANFPDALSASPLAYALKAPFFFVDGDGNISDDELSALKRHAPKTILVVGGTDVISETAFAQANKVASSLGGVAVRLSGQTRYETSAAIARYAVKNLGFSWNGLAFASGQSPYDALCGSVIQGREKSVLLLADEWMLDNASVTDDSGVDSVKFFGGDAVLSATARAKICKALGVTYSGSFVPYTTYKRYNLSLEHMLQLQAARGDHSYSEYQQYVDPAQYEWRSMSYLVFALLDQGYTGLTARQLDDYIADACTYWEGVYGWKSTFRGMGQAFIDAAKASGLNEAYLLAHAKIESAWGCSNFAHGWSPDHDGQYEVKGRVFKYYNGTTYYNFLGIGAYDNNPSDGAHIMSIKEGWTTPEKTIMGSAMWLSDNYVRRRYRQNTPYLQRFDCAGSEVEDDAWHEYCTGLT